MSKRAGDQDWLIARPRYILAYTSRRGNEASEQLSFDYSIHYFPESAAQLEQATETFTIKPPGFAFIQPGRAYQIRSSQPARALSLQIKSEMILELAAQIGFDSQGSEIFFLHSIAGDLPGLRMLAETLISELQSAKPGQQQVVDAVVIQFAIALLRDWLGVRRNPHLEISRVGIVDRRLRRAIEFIHSHYDRELALAEIAQAAFLSEYHFAHLFKRIIGLTPHNYLAALRVEQARRLIAETDLSIAEISISVGYASQSHFTKIFRSLTGHTPAKYRERLQQSQKP